ncbi:MAG: HD domain-containing protein [Desulfuromonas sp.]|nr:HD domain-containing protein [Desulfuromonas sp.]
MIQPIEIINKYYLPTTRAHHILLVHSRQVADKALTIARRLKGSHDIDVEFIEQAAMLHDIGMLATKAPALGCYGTLPYLCHGIEGAKILVREGLPRHAKVCEHHIGVGLTADEIERDNLPLPRRDMLPTTIEEQIIAYADLFFSKNPKTLHQEFSIEQVRRSVCQYGAEKGEIFDRWQKLFSST